MSQDLSVSEAAYEDTLQEINDVISAIAQLANQEVTRDQFFAEFIDVCVRTLAATAGCVWLVNRDQIAPEYHSHLHDTGLPDVSEWNSTDEHFRLIRHIIDEPSESGMALPPHVGSVSASTDQQPSSTILANPTDYLLLISPIRVDGRTLGVVEVFQRPDAPPAALQGFLRFQDSLADLAARFLRNSQHRQLLQQADLAARFQEFTVQIHQGLDLRRTAVAIANGVKNVAGCDRVSIAIGSGRRIRMAAVSGVDSIDRRSNLVRSAEALMRQIGKTRQPFWHRDDDDSASQQSLPSQICKPLEQFLDESPAREIVVVPLLQPSRPDKSNVSAAAKHNSTTNRLNAVLLIERFEPAYDSLYQSRVEAVGQQSALAVANALELNNLPFLPVIRLIQRIGLRFTLRQLPKTTLVLGLLAAAIAALVLVPAEFTIDGRGELQPAERRGVFASSDGIVEVLSDKLAAGDSSPNVDQDEFLIQLSDSKLEFERTRIDGELKTARASLVAKQIHRRNLRPTDPNVRDELDQLSAEETELEIEINGLEAQLEVLNRQQAALKLKSPIKGTVMTFDASRFLDGRPVRQGERLLEVAKVDGKWVLEVRIRDQNIQHIKNAQQSIKQKLDVSFVLATNPEKIYHGKLQSIANETEHHEQDGPTVLITVAIDRKDIAKDQLRMGATVIPHVHCGTRSIGFVWFHEVIHAVKTRLLF